MQRPNILIFMTDHQRGDTALPGHAARTPHLDALARQGVRFTETFCPSPHCCPSRASFFSGVYPSRHGVWNNVSNASALSRGLKDGVRLWSEDLAAAGYRMSFHGKWHVSNEEHPAGRGWNAGFVSSGPGAHHGQSWDKYRDLAARPEKGERGEGEILRPGYGTYRLYGTQPEKTGDHDTAMLESALPALDELLASGSDDPWCLWAGAIGPHDPYVVPQKYLDLYDVEEVPLPTSYDDDLRDKPGLYRRMKEQVFGQLSPREVREAIRHFWAYCTYMDDLFGQLMARLDASGQAENTLVLFASDHGDYVGEHGLFCKGIPAFRGAYHVPAVVRWPAAINNAGRDESALISLCDFGPTFLDAAGITYEDERFTGASLLPFLRNEAPDNWRDAMFSQCNGVEVYVTQRAVWTKQAKYVYNAFDSDELYDLTRDPHELRNLAGDPAYAELKRELCAQMWRFAAEQDDTTSISPYITVGLAPYGPGEAFRAPQEASAPS